MTRRVMSMRIPDDVAVVHLICILDKLPHDAYIISTREDFCSRSTFYFLEHHSFKRVTPGDIPPEIPISWGYNEPPEVLYTFEEQDDTD